MRRTLFTVLSVVALLATGMVAGLAVGDGDPPPRIAFLANGINPADALAAGSIAGQLGAPLFTTTPASLEPAAEAGIVAYEPELVIALGGPVALADAVLVQLSTATGLAIVTTEAPTDGIVRVAGETRYSTAVAVAELLGVYNSAFEPAGNFALADTSCAAGEVVTGIAADGTPTCAVDQVDGGNADTLDGLNSDAWLTREEADEQFAARGTGQLFAFVNEASGSVAGQSTAEIARIDFEIPTECSLDDDVTDRHTLAISVTGNTNETDDLVIDHMISVGGIEVASVSSLSASNGIIDLPFSLNAGAFAGAGTIPIVYSVQNIASDSTSIQHVSLQVTQMGWTCEPAF